MEGKSNTMNKMFDEIGFELIECVRKCVEKNQKSLAKIAEYMKISSSSLVIDILIPQTTAVMFMSGLIDDISPEDFIYYTDSFTDMIKKDIFKIRAARAGRLDQEG